MFCGFAIRSREIVICYGLGDYKSPGLIGRTFFLRRIANPSGRLAGCGTLGGVYGTAGEGGFQGTKKSRGILEGESPRQLKFQRPV